MADTKTVAPKEGALVRFWNWLTETQAWTSIFRHGRPTTDRNRVLVMLSNVFLHLHPVRIRKSGVKLRYTWCMGGMSFFLFLSLTLTGLLLMFYYRPTLEYAYTDIVGLREHVPLGIMREMHRWGAHAMVITVWLHMFRVFMTGSYKPPREFNWSVGVIMLVLTLLLSFTGYLLPWDQLAIWAITVGSGMARATPFLGHEGPGASLLRLGDVPLIHASDDARFALLGGTFVGEGALLRFYVLHCVGLIFLLLFFVWYSVREGVLNDRRIAAGQGPIEKAESDRVWVWPDLVYTELISLILCSVVLIVWSIFLKAPLEQPANPSNTPNPSKAPWYFLGLQEMLVYFDPWLAGVVLPSLIIVGLICIPYIDKNPKGNGYYTFAERRAEITIFLFGFAVLWASLIVLGTFLRGPNWNFFGPFEFWDIHKLAALNNVNLSEYVWVRTLRTGLPSNWFIREIFGIILVLFYILALPVILAKAWFKGYYEKMGGPRYYVGAFLFLMMMALPIKMLARWLFNLKYIVSIGEYFFNI